MFHVVVHVFENRYVEFDWKVCQHLAVTQIRIVLKRKCAYLYEN